MAGMNHGKGTGSYAKKYDSTYKKVGEAGKVSEKIVDPSDDDKKMNLKSNMTVKKGLIRKKGESLDAFMARVKAAGPDYAHQYEKLIKSKGEDYASGGQNIDEID